MMAKGDIINDAFVLTNGAHRVVQPASGVEYIIAEVFSSSQADDIQLSLDDGSMNALIGPNTKHYQGKIFINNTRYLDIGNMNAGSKVLGYTGVQVK